METNLWRFLVVDVSDPSNPKPVSKLDLPGKPEGIQVVNQMAYVTAGNYLCQIDISQPAFSNIATLVGLELGEGHESSGIDVANGYAYVSGRNEFVVVNLTNSMSSAIVSSWINADYESDFQGIQVRDSYAYVLSASETSNTDIYRSNGTSTPPGKLFVFDISIPTMLRLVAECKVGGRARNIYLDGNYAYIAGGAWDDKPQDWRYGLEIIDIHNPLHPVRVGALDTGGYARDVKVKDGFAYIAAGDQGLLILKATPVLQLNPPTISGQTLTLTWQEFPGVKLQRASSLYQPIWKDVTISNRQSRIEMPMQEASGYFRLHKP